MISLKIINLVTYFRNGHQEIIIRILCLDLDLLNSKVLGSSSLKFNFYINFMELAITQVRNCIQAS